MMNHEDPDRFQRWREDPESYIRDTLDSFRHLREVAKDIEGPGSERKIDELTAKWRDDFAEVGIDPYDRETLRVLVAVVNAARWGMNLGGPMGVVWLISALGYACLEFDKGRPDISVEELEAMFEGVDGE